MKPFRRICALLVLSLLLAAPAFATPALWVARKDQATVYLFGTVHLLPSDTNWSSQALDRALEASGTLLIELVDDNPANMQALVLKYGLDPAHPLSAKLSPRDRNRLERAANEAELPGGAATLQPMRPWLAAVTLAMTPLVRAGMDPAQGVDRTLRARMEKAGKAVQGLETAEQQLRMLADMPESMQLSFLRQSLDEVAEGPARLRELIDAWRRGDTDTIARIEDEDLRKDTPELYDRMLVQRNQAWAKAIAERMHQPGTTFVAVGAGHLAGPDSLQKQLEKLGVEVKRE
ncbi:TraB/GumN family protein [Dyella sp. BiH032]|uniref:TraB/GumN family protein n=1 Tax=Dyella sp. BiH032 TaxID=3075430 RepID=UPI002892F565|nr:TraB/GumN family protein [Dyella sp. BiH032]WNL47447.1 TraB/GumN family protein [Dyella sp. BiH032]